MPRTHTILNSASNSDPVACDFVVRDTSIKCVLEADLSQVEAEMHLSFGGCIRESKKKLLLGSNLLGRLDSKPSTPVFQLCVSGLVNLKFGTLLRSQHQEGVSPCVETLSRYINYEKEEHVFISKQD